MTSAAAARTPLGTRAQPGLILSIGIKRPDKTHPEKLDYFRCKPGPFADKFVAVFGAEPREVNIAPPSNQFGDMLAIHWKAFAGGGPNKPDGGYLKALGHTNYADLALAGDRAAMNGPETLTGWNQDGSRGEFEITGPDDPAVTKFGLKIYTVVRFLIPEVLGFGTWAEISTTSEISTHNLFRSLAQIYRATRGEWYGAELVLFLAPAKARPVVDGKRITSRFWALDVRSPKSIAEFLEERAEKALLQGDAPRQLPAIDHASVERDLEVSPALWSGAGEPIRQALAALPPPGDEPLRTREEPTIVERPDDATLNRIAALRSEIGAGADLLLTGAFGKDSPDELDAQQAAMYLQGLERIADAAEPVEGEVVDAG